MVATSARSSADTRERYREELLASAAKAIDEGHHHEAITAWRAAYEVRPEYWIACNIGETELEHGSAREAARYLEACLRLAPSNAPPEDKRLLEHYGDELKALRKQVSSLRILVDQEGANVSIDGKSTGRSPVPEAFVDPGPHRVAIELAGYKPEEIAVAVGKGESRMLAVTLKKDKAAPPPLPASVSAVSPPGATASRSPILLAGGASAVALALGFGVVFTIAADNADDEAQGYNILLRERHGDDCGPNSTKPDCQRFQSADQERQQLSVLATGSFIGAGVAAAATITYVLFPRSPVRPLVGKGASVIVAEW